jgi:hypothetical protein
MQEANALGYFPQDDAEVFATTVLAGKAALDPGDPVHRLVGGHLTLSTFDADRLT